MMKSVFFVIIFLCFIISVGYFVNDITEDWNKPNQSSDIKNNSIPKFQLDIGERTPKLEFVSATEYTKGDGNGSTIVKLIDWRGDKINTTCWETILYPNKTTYVDWTEMIQHWEFGNYYLNFVVPETLGIYDQEVRCLVSNKNISIGKGFHVGNISNIVTNNIDDLKVDTMTVWS